MISKPSPLIVLIGDVMVDIVATLSGELRRGTDTASTNSFSGGGSAANTAAWLGWSKQTAVMIGAVGTDAMGVGASAELTAVGVRPQLQKVGDAATGSVIAIVHPDGERTMFPDAGANLRLSAEHVTQVLTECAATTSSMHVHVSGYTLLREQTRATALHALAVARNLAATTSIDPSSTGPIDDAGLATSRTLFAGVDLLVANADEACLLTNEVDTHTAAQSLTELATEVIVKAGAGGAYWAHSDGRTHHEPALPVAVVDTLGAGDAFAAGALPLWRSGSSATDFLSAGSRLAAECVARAGARPPVA